MIAHFEKIYFYLILKVFRVPLLFQYYFKEKYLLFFYRIYFSSKFTETRKRSNLQSIVINNSTRRNFWQKEKNVNSKGKSDSLNKKLKNRIKEQNLCMKRIKFKKNFHTDKYEYVDLSKDTKKQ